MDSSCDAPSEPEICGSATFAMEVSRTSIKVASVTVSAITHGLTFRLLTLEIILYGTV